MNKKKISYKYKYFFLKKKKQNKKWVNYNNKYFNTNFSYKKIKI